MKKCLFLFAIVASLSAISDVGYKRLGSLKIKDKIVVGVEGVDNVVVEDGYKISSTYAGFQEIQVKVTSTSPTVTDNYRVENVAGEPWLIVTGKKRSVTNLELACNGFQCILLNMPTSGGDWFLNLNATNITGSITGKFQEGINYMNAVPEESFRDKSITNGLYFVGFTMLDSKTYLNYSSKLIDAFK